MLPTNQKGFTLIELCVVIVILGILIAVGVVSYEHAIESIRKTDVLVLMGAEIPAQNRYFLMRHHYARAWHLLDAAPSVVRTPSADNPYANGLENTIFFTRGKDANGEPRSGFQVYFENIGTAWFMTADRVGSEKYGYTLIRPFDAEQVYCIPTKHNNPSIKICTDFMGVDTEDQIPPDPRLSVGLNDEHND